MRKAMISRLCSWFVFNYCDQHTMSWGNIMKLIHMAFFFSKFKPNSNWELMLSPVIRTILLLSLEFRNRQSVNHWISQCQPVHICKKQWSTVQFKRIVSLDFFLGFGYLIFDLLGGVIPGVWYTCMIFDGGGGGGLIFDF